MLTLTPNYKVKNDLLNKEPVYVLEIIFAGGGEGAEGVNDIYFTTCDVSGILNFPWPARWFPFLQSDSISGISQQVDPINGVSTIGNLSARITDHGGMVSDIIKAADVAGFGLRRQRVELYVLFKGLDWADRVRIRSLQVDDLKLSRYNEYTITAADVQMQLHRTVFNPAQTTLGVAIAAGVAVTVSVADARAFRAGSSVTYGANGFIKIDSEIMRWDSSTAGSFNIPAAGRGVFGSVTAAHALGATVDEIIYLNENPITMALKIIESSGVTGVNGTHDIYPAAWGSNMAAPGTVDEAGWLQVGELLTGLSASHLASDGLQFEFVINKGIEAKKFIEDSLLKIIGAYGFVRGDGSYSIRAYNDLANAQKENAQAWLTVDNVIKWSDLSYNYTSLANDLWIDYDEEPKLSGKYIRAAWFIDSVSQKKWGPAKQLKYVAQGIEPTSVFVNQLYQRFQRVLARYSRPPMQIPLTLMPKLHTLEIGDIVRVTLPIRDLLTGAALDRAFEVISVQLQTKTGEVDIICIAQPELANFWFNGVGAIASISISPALTSIPNGGTQQLVARTFDAGGVQVSIPAISWVAKGNVTVSSSGLVTATGVGSGSVYAVSGALISNSAVITVTAAANISPVAAVTVAPSSALLAAGQTQLASAIAKDAAGNQVNSVTFNWLSSNPAVATVPAGPGVSETVTAVANGTTNITATETVSGVISPVCVVTVATAVTPAYTPPIIADSAYQIGTQITSMGPVGGPHVIPNGYNFASGDYWFDGNVSLALGSACTINGTVRLFSLGVVTINGTVDGVGRGGAGAGVGNFSTQQGMIYYEYFSGGVSSASVGFVGSGGLGSSFPGGLFYPPLPALNTIVASPLFALAPSLNNIGTATSGGSITALAGLPTKLQGGGGSGGYSIFMNVSNTPNLPGNGGSGANGGAGLLIMARGIYVSVGLINLAGLPGTNGQLDIPAQVYESAGGGGGGGGGSFVALAQRDANGLPVMSIDPSRVFLSPGNGGANVLSNPLSWNVQVAVSNASPGTPGCFIHQVIG